MRTFTTSGRCCRTRASGLGAGQRVCRSGVKRFVLSLWYDSTGKSNKVGTLGSSRRRIPDRPREDSRGRSVGKLQLPLSGPKARDNTRSHSGISIPEPPISAGRSCIFGYAIHDVQDRFLVVDVHARFEPKPAVSQRRRHRLIRGWGVRYTSAHHSSCTTCECCPRSCCNCRFAQHLESVQTRPVATSERIHRTRRPMAAGLTVAITHRNRLTRHHELHRTAKATASVSYRSGSWGRSLHRLRRDSLRGLRRMRRQPRSVYAAQRFFGVDVSARVGRVARTATSRSTGSAPCGVTLMVDLY